MEVYKKEQLCEKVRKKKRYCSRKMHDRWINGWERYRRIRYVDLEEIWKPWISVNKPTEVVSSLTVLTRSSRLKKKKL